MALGDRVLVQVAEAREPAVGEPTGQPKHARPVRAEPDPDGVRRGGPGLDPTQLVVVALVGDLLALAGPPRPHQLDRLREGVDRLTGLARRPAHRGDVLPEGARSKAELEPAGAQEVDRGGGLGDHRRRPQRQVGHVRRQADAPRAGGEVGEERESVEEAALVGVVLDCNEVEPHLLRGQRLLYRALGVAGVRYDEYSDLGHTAMLLPCTST